MIFHYGQHPNFTLGAVFITTFPLCVIMVVSEPYRLGFYVSRQCGYPSIYRIFTGKMRYPRRFQSPKVMKFEGEVRRVLDHHLLDDVIDIVASYLELSLLPKWWWESKYSHPLVPAYVGDNKIAVSSYYMITIYTTEGKFLYRWGKGDKRPGEFNRALGITRLRPSEMAVCDVGNHRIQVFSLLPGEEGRFLPQSGSGEVEVKGMASSMSRQVSLSQRNARKSSSPTHITIASKSSLRKGGSYRRAVVGANGSKIGGVCISERSYYPSRGKVAVCDRFNHRIQIFAADGQFLRHLGCQHSTPSWIASSPGGKRIAVVESDTQQLVIYSSTGEFTVRLGVDALSWDHEIRSIGITALPSDEWVCKIIVLEPFFV